MRKRIKLSIATLVVSMVAATSAYAATAEFSAKLPAKQGDTEVSKVARVSTTSEKKNFGVKITSIDSGYTAVRGWTESTAGGNFSNPYNEVPADNKYYYHNYSTVPAKGTNVTLNLDNPVHTSTIVSAKGIWTPN